MTSPARISVALCTYNGQPFLSEQLASIARQTRQPDELVVCDDCSNDLTLKILREFAATVPFVVRIFENEHNLGYTANFEKAIHLCTGELIALSDQDDIWYPSRLARSEQELRTDPLAGLVFSDADVIDKQGRLTGQTIWQRLHLAGAVKQELASRNYIFLAKHRFVTGATMMFRADLRNRFLPIGAGWIHDEWIAMVVAAFSDLKAVAEPLIRYRTHGSQQVGFQNKFRRRALAQTHAEQHWERLDESGRELEELCDALTAMHPNDQRGALQAYQQQLAFIRFRSQLPVERFRRLRPILEHYRDYVIHASGVGSVLKDFALSRRTGKDSVE